MKMTSDIIQNLHVMATFNHPKLGSSSIRSTKGVQFLVFNLESWNFNYFDLFCILVAVNFPPGNTASREAGNYILILCLMVSELSVN